MPSLLSSSLWSLVLSLGTMLFWISYLIQRFRSGPRQSTKDLIDELTGQLKAQSQVIESMKGQIKELSDEVHHLKGVNEANDKKINEYMQIITNRNPDLDKTLLNISGVVTEVVPFMGEMKESHKYLRETLDALAQRGRVKVNHDAH